MMNNKIFTIILLITVLYNVSIFATDTDKLLLGIEEICGNKLSQFKDIKELGVSQFSELYKTEYNDEKICKSCSNTFGFYSQKDKSVYLCQDLFKNMPGALTKDDIPIMRDLIIFHELVHAWQDETGFMNTEIHSHIRSALIEGHAEYMTEKFAIKKGWNDQLKMYMGLKQDISDTVRKSKKVRPDIFFYYAQGCKFLKYIMITI